MDFRKQIISSVLLAILATCETQASTFQLTESISDIYNNYSTATATFTGVLEGNYVDNISNVSLSINGTSPLSTVYAEGGDAQGIFHIGQAIVGTNGYQQLNNFYFVNDAIPNDSYPPFEYYVFAGLTAYENAANPQYGTTLYTLIEDQSTDTRIFDSIGSNLYYYENATQTSYTTSYTTKINPTFTYNLVETPSAVPIPAAVWLFGSALVGFIGFNRRKPMHQAV